MSVERTADVLAREGLATTDWAAPPVSRGRFPDGGRYRIEIATVEGVAAFETVLREAAARSLPVHRVSQGSGGMLLTEQDVAELCRLQDTSGTAYLPFVGPRAGWDLGVQASSPAGRVVAGSLRGSDQVRYAVRDVLRLADAGFAGVLVADLGLLAVLGRCKAAGDLPPEFSLKTSIFLPVANAAAARVLEDLGATSLNLPVDLPLPQLASLRAAVDLPLDLYVESPDDVGGVVRHYETASFVRHLSPITLKFSVRNAPGIYPSGQHLEAIALATAVERVRRARIALDIFAAEDPEGAAACSPVPTTGAR